MRIVTIICWGIAAAALVGLALWFITGTVFGIRSDRLNIGRWGVNWSPSINIGNWEVLTGPYEEVGSQTIAISDINTINVDWISSSVRVEPYGGNEIKITEFAQRGLNDNERMFITTSGGVLQIKFCERSVVNRMPQKKLEVLVPQAFSQMLERLSVDTISGEIYVDGINANTLRTESTSGSVHITNSGSHVLLINTISGSIAVDNMQARNMQVESTSGSITLTETHADSMKIESISGSHRVSESSAGAIDNQTTSGSISVTGSFDSAKLESLSGRISLDNSASSAKLKVNSTSGSLDMRGAFYDINAETLSGSISIRSLIVPESCDVSSTSGSVTIAVPNTGSISVHHSSTSGSFSSDIPVTMQGRGAQFNISTLSGSTRIRVID